MIAITDDDPTRLAGRLAFAGARSFVCWRDGALVLMCTGGRPSTRCLLDGVIDNLEEIAPDGDVSDPEALLHRLWLQLGARALFARLRGAFALVLWEPAGRRLFAARDHMGEGGLAWCREGGDLFLAREPGDLAVVVRRTPPPDPAALGNWLSIEGMPDDRTLFEGIRRVRHGHFLTAAGTSIAADPYWEPPDPAFQASRPAPRSEVHAAAERVREQLEIAVGRRRHGPTGVLLSGGLDSSSVAAVGVRAVSPPAVTRAYSAVFPAHPSADEAALIALTSEDLGIDSVRARVRAGSVVAGALPYLGEWLLPPATPNLFFWLPLLSRAAEDGYRTLLDGQGGDEVFGLAPALVADCLARGDLLGAVRLVARAPGGRYRPPGREVVRWLYRYGLRGLTPPWLSAARRTVRRTAIAGPEWLRPEIGRAVDAVQRPGGWKRSGVPRWWAQLVAEVVDGPGTSLAYDDIRRRDALAGVRTRHPLTDADLVQFVLTLDPALAFDPYVTRPLLRFAVAGLLVDRVRLRAAKTSFDAPFHAALAGPDLRIVRDLLSGHGTLLGEYVDLGLVRRRLLDVVPAPGARQGWALHLWRLATAEMWLRTCADRQFPQRLQARCAWSADDVELVPEPVAGTSPA